MATYPVNQGGVGAKVRTFPNAGIRTTSMADGTIRGFTDFAQDVFDITIEHFWLGATDRDAIMTFYETNKTAQNSVAADEGNFNAYFVNRPQITDKSGALSMVVSRLIGVKV